ncbi:glycosyltransferase [Aeromicrobium sp.]|uniref:glycosyltransferase n=1 Tax=Aeromicrobium sp. TaxID=1871063 RepID=UPI0019A71109|nr:glycosyltransferase [Aeromicrobium sp.]MBC7630441.1 glycosyltransferase [Aeromicrobium sp.]
MSTSASRAEPAAARERAAVAVYRDVWLPPSEGFVLEPTTHFCRYRAVPVGLELAGRPHPLVEADRVRLLGRPADAAALCRLRTRGFPTGRPRALLGPDIRLVHAHFGPDALLGQHIAADLDVPLAVTLHGYDITTQDRDFLRNRIGRNYLALRHRLKRRVPLLLPVSDFLRAEMLRKGWPSGRTVTHHLGVDTSYWTPEKASNARRDVLFVGRLVAVKGAAAAVAAFMRLRDEHPEARLHVVGEGPERAALEQASVASGGRVLMHGSLPRERIRELMRTCAVVLAPSEHSRGRREALSLVALEAAASGLPVVAYASGGLPEVVKHGVTGLLAAEGDWAGLVDHLRSVLTDAERATELGDQARERCVASFSMATQARLLEDLFDDLISSDNP